MSIPFDLIDPAALVRVEDPAAPGALARSSTGAVLVGPPSSGRWRVETVAEPDLGNDEDTWGQRESLTVTNADLWHADGVTGRGVKVAVFDVGWYGGDADPSVAGDVITHDCFASVTCEVPFDPLRPHLDGELGVHGWACAEAIRDVAPDVELHVVRAPSFTALENAVAWAVRERIDVVSMSMSFYNDSFYDGTGPHDALVRDLEAAGVLMVGSAGNDALKHWSGPWLDADADGRLDGDGGNGLWVYWERDAGAYLNWNQHARCGLTDLAAVVTEADGTVITVQDEEQVAADDGKACVPVERVSAPLPREGWYRLEVHLVRGSTVGLAVDLNSRGGDFDVPVSYGSLSDPKAHPLVASVAAVRASRYLEGGLESFSSWGPNAGGWPKPDIAGPDGLSSAAYGPVGFYGTSASAPVVAGLVALVLDDDPTLTSREAFERLQAWAIPSGATSSSPDLKLGAGKARLPVRDPGPQECGRRPLLLAVVPIPLWTRRRRR